MKIPLTYANNRLILNTTIYCSGAHKGFISIAFIIDTGNPETFISEGDALRSNFPLNKFSDHKSIKMGGSTYQLKILNRQASMYVKNEEGKSNKITLPYLKIVKCSKTIGKAKNESLNFPSLIGMDFLEERGFILYCDLKNNNCYLELKDLET